MLLTIDAGNSDIKFGVFDEKELIATFHIVSKSNRTSDEFGVLIRDMLLYNGISTEDITGVAVSSVVPNINHSLTHAVQKYLQQTPLIIGPGTKTGLKITTANPKEIGSNRIVDAVAAYEKMGGPILVLNFGTATTYDYVTAEGAFAAGITAPGIRISAKALWEDAAKLPEIEIKKPDTILAQDTITSMQAGLIYGQIGQTQYIIEKVKEETGISDIKTIVTGGLGRIIASAFTPNLPYDPNLTMDGIRIIYERNQKA